MNLIYKSTIWTIIKSVSMVSGVFIILLITNYYGSGDYGNFVLFFNGTLIFTLLTDMGLSGTSGALVKRISSRDCNDGYISTVLLLRFGVLFIIAIGLFSGREFVADLFGLKWSLLYLIPALTGNVILETLLSVLRGEGKIAKSGLSMFVRDTFRYAYWVAAVGVGADSIHLLYGYIASLFLGSGFALRWISTEWFLPSKEAAYNLISYGKFSWIHNIRGGTYSYMDTLVLGLFVTPSVVGIYQVAWSISRIFIMFSSAIGRSQFDELSSLETDHEIRKSINDSLSYTSIFIIPGLVGAAIFGEYILSFYGPRFTAGFIPLLMLIVARLFQSYESVLSNVLLALGFTRRAAIFGTIFVVINISVNLVLGYLWGPIGVAAATMGSVAIVSLLSWDYLRGTHRLKFPIKKTTYQFVSATVMGLVLLIYNQLFQNNALGILFGVIVYLGLVVLIDSDLKSSVIDAIAYVR